MSFCETSRVRIESDLAPGRRAMAIWQDLVDEQCFEELQDGLMRPA